MEAQVFYMLGSDLTQYPSINLVSEQGDELEDESLLRWGCFVWFLVVSEESKSNCQIKSWLKYIVGNWVCEFLYIYIYIYICCIFECVSAGPRMCSKQDHKHVIWVCDLKFVEVAWEPSRIGRRQHRRWRMCRHIYHALGEGNITGKYRWRGCHRWNIPVYVIAQLFGK